MPLPVKDTLKPRTDTIRAGFSRAELPPSTEIGPSWHWNRAELFASGAVSLSDLLERVPGVTGLHAGWFPLPATAVYGGDPDRVRVFLDGIELDPLDARTGAVPDLSVIELWSLEDVLIERHAGEIRVHLRTWRVDRTTPYTRTDILTGDLETNLYRGFYGRRFFNGLGLQVGAQQYSISDQRLGGGGGGLGLFTRFGWARGKWSADGLLDRGRRGYDEILRSQPVNTRMPPEEVTGSTTYLRLGYGDPGGDHGLWAQAVAASRRFSETSPHRGAAVAGPLGFPADTVDTLTSRAQYVASAGYMRGPWRTSVGTRMRAFAGSSSQAPEARLSFDTRRLTLLLSGDRAPIASSVARPGTGRATTLDASARVLPLSWIALGGGVTRRQPADSADGPASLSVRGEAGIRILRRGLWVTGSVLTRDTALLRPPVIFDSAYRAASVGRATATVAAIRGTLYHALQVDAWGVRWSDTAGFYRPRWQTRSALSMNTNWLGRFPSGHFTLIAAAVHEYRSNLYIPTAGTPLRAGQSRVLSTLLEIRILGGSVSWQYRNLIGEDYQLVPGLGMPRQTNIYGIRWDFWN